MANLVRASPVVVRMVSRVIVAPDVTHRSAIIFCVMVRTIVQAATPAIVILFDKHPGGSATLCLGGSGGQSDAGRDEQNRGRTTYCQVVYLHEPTIECGARPSLPGKGYAPVTSATKIDLIGKRVEEF